jgi:hypothetical protein
MLLHPPWTPASEDLRAKGAVHEEEVGGAAPGLPGLPLNHPVEEGGAVSDTGLAASNPQHTHTTLEHVTCSGLARSDDAPSPPGSWGLRCSPAEGTTSSWHRASATSVRGCALMCAIPLLHLGMQTPDGERILGLVLWHLWDWNACGQE